MSKKDSSVAARGSSRKTVAANGGASVPSAPFLAQVAALKAAYHNVEKLRVGFASELSQRAWRHLFNAGGHLESALLLIGAEQPRARNDKLNDAGEKP